MNRSGMADLKQLAEEILPHIFVRAEDRVMILPPNQVFSLNDSAVRVLVFLKQGGDLSRLPDSFSDPGKVLTDLETLFSGIRSLLKREENPAHIPGVEMKPFAKEFYIYPILSEFAVTYRCNLSCAFCYLPSRKEVKRELSTRQAKGILDKLKSEAKVPFVSFTGGEPLIRKDLEILISHARKIGLKVNLISNGTLISVERAKKLLGAGLTSAQISLESPVAEVHNRLTGGESFENTLNGIRNLRDQGIYVHTNTTISRSNLDSIAGLPELVRELGLPKFSANLIIPVGRAGENRPLWIPYTEIGATIQVLREAAEAAGVEFIWYSPLPYCIYNPAAKGMGVTSCAACHGLVHVDPYGRILPCSSYSQPVGDWNREKFSDIWFGKRAMGFRHLDYLPRVCRQCEHKEICAGACPLYWEKIGYEEIAG